MAGPTKYKPEYCKSVITHMEQGYSFDSFGALAHVSRDTLYKWVHAYPEFAEAKYEAELKCLYFWERLGLEGVQGRIDKFSHAVYCFSMKARFVKYGWRDIPSKEEDEAMMEEAKLKKKLAELSDDEFTQTLEQALAEAKARCK